MIVNVKETLDIAETKVEIFCKYIDEETERLLRHIKLFSKILIAKDNNNYVLISALEIFYIESVDGRTFVYTQANVYETEFRLYELMEFFCDNEFIRASKSAIINLQKVDVLTPELNRSMLATMKNGEKVSISRQYAKELKKLLKQGKRY